MSNQANLFANKLVKNFNEPKSNDFEKYSSLFSFFLHAYIS